MHRFPPFSLFRFNVFSTESFLRVISPCRRSYGPTRPSGRSATPRPGPTKDRGNIEEISDIFWHKVQMKKIV